MIIEKKTYYDKNNKLRVKCLRRCSKCKTEEWLNDYYAVKNRKRHYCYNCSNLKNGQSRQGVPRPETRGRRKADDEYILGSTYLNSSGYLEEYVGRHNNKRGGGYYLQHRKIIEEFLKRKLLPNELVHHINGDKIDNRIENLHVCSSISEHKLLHNQLEKLSFELIKLGIIIFDKKSKEYKIAP